MGVRPAAVALLPASPGVYRFRDARGVALYVGRAADLRRRVSSYWGDLRGRSHLRRMVPQVAAVEALVCVSEHEAAWAERMLLEHRKPRWNRIAGGLENPVYVRVDTSAPSIAVVHEPPEADGVRCYGPFLGGTAARLAVAGLARVYPMAYARSHLTGTERDLARIHGVARADANALVEAVDQVLRRDPGAVAAVRSALVARREAAAGCEQYELAARIHEELGGLEWLVAPVRLFRTDTDLVGVAGGMQVTLAFRSGRLRTWEQSRPTTEMVAPPDWASTMTSNALLAATLAAHPVR